MATKRTKSESKELPSFEAALERLEQIVHDLEDGELGLDQSLERYEEGVKYLKFCHQKLKDTEQKIELLTGVDAQGNPVAVPFDDPVPTDGPVPLDGPGADVEEKHASRSKRRSRPKKQSKAESPPEPDVDIQGDLF